MCENLSNASKSHYVHKAEEVGYNYKDEKWLHDSVFGVESIYGMFSMQLR